MRCSGKPCCPGQVLHGGLGALVAELEVVLLGSDVVGVTLDLDVDALVLGLHVLGELIQRRGALGAQGGLVEAELHLLVGQNGLADERALGQLAGRSGARQGVLRRLRELGDLILELLVLGLQIGDRLLVRPRPRSEPRRSFAVFT